ncbi:MAG: UvrB/UvrC motif-containing protein [Planctomycetota bacterium]
MLCQRCGEREATIHEVTIRNGKSREHHLCEGCAQDVGMQGSSPPSMEQLLPGLIDASAFAAEADTDVDADAPAKGPTKPTQPNPSPSANPAACEGCGMTFADFKRSGLLGCAGCYECFEERLGPLIERAHEGGGPHVGKVPRRALDDSRHGAHPERLAALLGDQRERTERLATLRSQLEKAVAAEQYERAAALRDEIQRVSVVDAGETGGSA